MARLSSNSGYRIRKILPGIDNNGIADLIEKSFHQFLDPDGRTFIASLRQRAKADNFFNRLPFVHDNPEAEGFVCVNEAGKIVGLLHLIPIFPPEGSGYLIVNVCVAEDSRRNGIAAELLETAIGYARNFSASSLHLQVREGTDTALHLYETHGFRVIARRADRIRSKTGSEDFAIFGRLETTCREPHGGERSEFLRAAAAEYPPSLRWNIGWEDALFDFSSWSRAFRRLMRSREEFWTVTRSSGSSQSERKLGWIGLLPTINYANRLWIIPNENASEEDRFALTATAIRKFRSGKPLLLNTSWDVPDAPYDTLGFNSVQRLIWMSLDLFPKNEVPESC